MPSQLTQRLQWRAITVPKYFWTKLVSPLGRGRAHSGSSLNTWHRQHHSTYKTIKNKNKLLIHSKKKSTVLSNIIGYGEKSESKDVKVKAKKRRTKGKKCEKKLTTRQKIPLTFNPSQNNIYLSMFLCLCVCVVLYENEISLCFLFCHVRYIYNTFCAV